ncbi:hypothetical protein BaRGS_00028441 [Batillaria attramentaria]|uniref:Uncharacterized protein n=1 Tax=Batillaria attramentaria TaxID=370345 RepID=A0ABD0JZE9_9CAEN
MVWAFRSHIRGTAAACVRLSAPSYHLRPFPTECLDILHLTPGVYCSRLHTRFCLYHTILGLLHQRVCAFGCHTCVLQPPAYTFLLFHRVSGPFASHTCCVVQPPAYTFLPVSSHLCTADACIHISACIIPSQAFCTRGSGHLDLTPVYCRRLHTHFCLYHTISGLLHQRLWAFGSHTCVLQPPAYTFPPVSSHLCTADACTHVSACIIPSQAFCTRGSGLLDLTPVYCSRLHTRFCLYHTISGLLHQRLWAFGSHTCVLQPPVHTFLPVSYHLRPFAPEALGFWISHLCTAAACTHVSACIIPSQAFCTRGSGHLDLTPVYCSRLHTRFCLYHTISGLLHQRLWAFGSHTCVLQPPAYTFPPVSSHLYTADACIHISACIIPSQAFCTRGSGHSDLTPVYCSRLRTPFCSFIVCLDLLHVTPAVYCSRLRTPSCLYHHTCVLQTPAYTFLPVSYHLRPFAPEALGIWISHLCTAAACVHLPACITTPVYCSRLHTRFCLYHTISGLLHQRLWAFGITDTCVLQPPAYTFLLLHTILGLLHQSVWTFCISPAV